MVPRQSSKASSNTNGNVTMIASHVSTTAPSTRGSSFLAHPAEIRNVIYELAMVDDRPIMIWGHLQPVLTRVCKQVRSEALPIFYGANRFDIDPDSEHKPCEHLAYALDMIGAEWIALIRKVHVDTWNELHENLWHGVMKRVDISLIRTAPGYLFTFATPSGGTGDQTKKEMQAFKLYLEAKMKRLLRRRESASFTKQDLMDLLRASYFPEYVI